MKIKDHIAFALFILMFFVIAIVFGVAIDTIIV